MTFLFCFAHFFKKTIDILFLDAKIINNYFELLMAVLFVTDLKFMSRRAVSISIWIYDVDFFTLFFGIGGLKWKGTSISKLRKKHIKNI